MAVTKYLAIVNNYEGQGDYDEIITSDCYLCDSSKSRLSFTISKNYFQANNNYNNVIYVEYSGDYYIFDYSKKFSMPQSGYFGIGLNQLEKEVTVISPAIYFGEILVGNAGNAKEEITEPEENLNYITVEIIKKSNHEGGSTTN